MAFIGHGRRFCFDVEQEQSGERVDVPVLLPAESYCRKKAAACRGLDNGGLDRGETLTSTSTASAISRDPARPRASTISHDPAAARRTPGPRAGGGTPVDPPRAAPRHATRGRPSPSSAGAAGVVPHLQLDVACRLSTSILCVRGPWSVRVPCA